VALDPVGLGAWLVLGAVAGWVVGWFVPGRGLGPAGDAAVGIVGAFAGAFGLLLLGATGSVGLVIAVAVAATGAFVPIVVVRVLGSRRWRPPKADLAPSDTTPASTATNRP
jgi:uncharacterized membrane protein YeaQ/YmgE (transglycosylase-associated protein family)